MCSPLQAKRGTGKTTTAAALAQAAAAARRSVLAIDLDPQGNLSFMLAADQTQPGAYSLITGIPADQLIQRTAQGMDVIPGSPDLATLKTKAASALRLQQALEKVQGYDLIIIDTPPTVGELTFNALQASSHLLIPLETDTASLQGLYQLTDIARQMQHSNPRLQIVGTILTRYDNRPRINRQLRDVIADKGKKPGRRCWGRSGQALPSVKPRRCSFPYLSTPRTASPHRITSSFSSNSIKSWRYKRQWQRRTSPT